MTEGGGGMGGASTVDVEIYGFDFETTDVVAQEVQAKMIATGLFPQVLLSRDEYIPCCRTRFSDSVPAPPLREGEIT